MYFKRYVLILLIGLGLQGCASTKMYQAVQQGKTDFQAGNFRQAFHRLLPAAANGNPEAEYAIGYMYYYGYGAPEDSESGLFWINKAAEQQYQPAIQALQLIQQTPPKAPNPATSNLPQYIPIKTSENETNEVSQPVTANNVAQTETLPVSPQRIAAASSVPKH